MSKNLHWIWVFPPIIVFELIETTWVMSFQIKKCYVFVVMNVHKLRILQLVKIDIIEGQYFIVMILI